MDLTQGPSGEDQRRRIVAAMAQIAAEQGEESVTVVRVVELADVSKEVFYEHFEDRSDCLSAVLDGFVSVLAERTRAAGCRQHTWQECVRAALLELLECLDANPRLARVCVAELVTGSMRGPARRGELLEQLVAVLDQGRALAPADRQPPDGAATSVIGGTLGMIHARLLGGDQPPLVELLNPLMGMVVLPYLGEAAALRELTRPVPTREPADPGARAWPAYDAGRGTTRPQPRSHP
ncbi:MAG TPA: TetR/AcrR family transcriptional regulator [Solirubrobacteraceae bacterium]|nr:TetR/AcrR family transcriptional regulator [Solirubrobacteraceae bacterium]